MASGKLNSNGEKEAKRIKALDDSNKKKKMKQMKQSN